MSEFAHLSPWGAASENLAPACVAVNREIVYVNLAWGEQEIWSRSISINCRKQIRKAQRAGVRIRCANSAEDIDKFHRLHKETMDRRAALNQYYRAPEYFHEIFRTLSENAFFVLAEYEDHVVAGGLFLHDETNVYWDLSALDMAFAHVRPVNAYVHETIRWACRQGKQRLLMGGGYQPGDGVFRFKAGFSPLRAEFSTYQRIHDAEAYEALNRAWSACHAPCSPPGDFFPAYRSMRRACTP